jgi:poly(hydroxyalkanoate) depolymerase family esterase
VNREQLAAMAEATALTRAGRLAEATALIQRTLAGDGPVRVVPGEIVVDEERLRDDGPDRPKEARPPDPDASTGRAHAMGPGPAGTEVNLVDPGRHPDPAVSRRGTEGNPLDTGRNPDTAGSRCGSGGLRDRLRERLAQAADGVRTHLPPAAFQHLPGSSILGGHSLESLRDLLGAPTAPGPAVPASPGKTLPGKTRQGVHRGAAGARPYTLYVPTTGTGARPLVVMLHGGTQTAADFAAATRMSELAEEHGVLVVYPEQVTSANPMRFWNWFKPGDQHRGGGEPAVLVGIVDEIAREHGVDRDRVYIAGFSAGAAMAAVLGAAYPDVFAAVGVHSGLPHGCAQDLPSAYAAMRGAARTRPLARRVPVIAFHGDADTIVAVDNAARVVEQFTAGPVRGDTLVERGSGRPATRVVVRRAGHVVGELWTVHGCGHAWSGGIAGGSFTDPAGPDASAEMLRFFADHPRRH